MTTYLITLGCHTVTDLVRNQRCQCLYTIVGQHRLARTRNGPCHPPQKTEES